MQEKGIITTYQNIVMLYIIIVSLVSLQPPGMLIMQAGRDSWLSVLGGWFLDVMLALVYAYMGIRFAGQNFVQYSITILGQYLGRIVGVTFPLFFLVVSMMLMRGLAQIIKLAFLPETPLAVILFSGFIVVGYGARKGIEVLGRVSEVLAPLYVITGLIMSLLVIPEAEIARLKPQFDQGVAPFLIGSPFMLTFYGICIMMAMFIPLCNRPENGFLAKFVAVSGGALSGGFVVCFSVAIFGIEQAQNMYSPGLQLARVVSIGRFLERLEVFWMMLAIGAGIMASAMMIWAFSLGTSQIVGLSTYKPLIYPTVLLSFVLSMTSFDGFTAQTNFVHYTFPIIGAFVEAGLEILLFIMALLLSKRGNTA